MCIQPWESAVFWINKVQLIQENYFYTNSHVFYLLNTSTHSSAVSYNCLSQLHAVNVKHPLTKVHTG
jgi:hypothetical protein